MNNNQGNNNNQELINLLISSAENLTKAADSLKGSPEENTDLEPKPAPEDEESISFYTPSDYNEEEHLTFCEMSRRALEEVKEQIKDLEAKKDKIEDQYIESQFVDGNTGTGVYLANWKDYKPVAAKFEQLEKILLWQLLPVIHKGTQRTAYYRYDLNVNILPDLRDDLKQCADLLDDIEKLSENLADDGSD